ncbi:MAG: hypothetical protein ISP88_14910 [Pseudomonadales bacterium]|jgi:hypothetical protein|nr:hypothetical protein [Pseudomonadales bacterium]
MSKIKLALGTLMLPALMLNSAAQADSLVDGIYQSDGDSNGAGQCTLIIRSVEQSHKYGDELFELESSGDGACEWSAVGISKSYAITAGLITNSGTPAFLKITFPFGPAGKQVKLTSYDLDGAVRNEESFAKTDDQLVARN